MHRKLWTIGIVVGSTFLLLLIGSFFIPVNHFRPTMEKEASIALGRKVQLGKLRLSLLRGQISAENLVISDDPRFSSPPFLTAKAPQPIRNSFRISAERQPVCSVQAAVLALP